MRTSVEPPAAGWRAAVTGKSRDAVLPAMVFVPDPPSACTHCSVGEESARRIATDKARAAARIDESRILTSSGSTRACWGWDAADASMAEPFPGNNSHRMIKMFRSLTPVARAALLTSTVLMVAAAADPDYKALREAGIGDSLLVENIVLHRDNGVVTLKSGSIGFTPQVAGRDTLAVFVGEGEFAFDPVLPVEKAHLKIVTGEETVREPFDRALFCFSDDTGKEICGQTRTPKPDAKLADALHDYRKMLRHSPERPRSPLEYTLTSESMDNLEADLLADLLNPRQPGFFSAYLHGRKHSDLPFHVK